MNEMNFDWDDLRLFLAVVRVGGLAGATEQTGKSAPTLGRRMVALEHRLGRELFHRTARGYDLTTEGHALLDELTGIEDRLLPLVNHAQTTRPLIKISAGTWVTRLLCQRLPDITGSNAARLRFIAAEQVLSVSHRETLIGIRNQRPEDSALICRRIGRVQFAVYARDALVTSWVQVLAQTPSARWVQQAIGTAPVIEVTQPRNALDLARAGCGRVVLPSFVGEADADLVRVSEPLDELDHDQWLVLHHEDRHAPAMRQVIRGITAVLRETCRTSRI